MQNNTTLEKTRQKKLARPLKVLVPLIKDDLRHADEAAQLAGMPYYIAAGEKLLEAKSQVSALEWTDWLSKNFHLTARSAQRYMAAARKNDAGVAFETLSHAGGDHRTHHMPSFTAPVQDVLKNLRTESLNLRAHDMSERKEQKLERELALQLIDIGYKVLATKLHPDKGGSADAMKRLNRVRARLKEAA